MKIGFIGLGTMGASLATNLQRAGYQLLVHDISRQVAEIHIDAGEKWAENPKEIAQECDIIMSSLPGPPEIETMALDEKYGLIAGLREGSVYFDLSTNSPTLIRKIYKIFSGHGAHVFDAPVSGSPNALDQPDPTRDA